MSDQSIEDLASHCIRCGFCLESCPTFQISGDESQSPRGRIYLTRSASEGILDWRDVQESMDTCLGCRACETSCPSGVEYGKLLELSREKLVETQPKTAQKLFLKVLTNPNLAQLQFKLSSTFKIKRAPEFLAKPLSKSKQQADIPKTTNLIWPKLNETKLPEIKGEVAMLVGCVMGVLYPGTHEATIRLLRRLGYKTHLIKGECCGALNAHSGFVDEARKQANKLANIIPDNMPIIINSAGCGSTMKEYAFLDSKLEGVASRVFDIAEYFLTNGGVELLQNSPGISVNATYHDACHLVHGQKISAQPRELIRAIPGLTYHELEEASMCCGSAGIFNIVQPDIAKTLLDRKWEHILNSGASVVATGNPGCLAWIQQASRESGRNISVWHTADLLEAACCGELPMVSR